MENINGLFRVYAADDGKCVIVSKENDSPVEPWEFEGTRTEVEDYVKKNNLTVIEDFM